MYKDETFILLRNLIKQVEQDFFEAVNKIGVTPQQGRILFFVINNYKDRDIHQYDIQEKFSLSKSTVSGLVKRMEAKNLISIKKINNTHVLIPAEGAHEVKDEFINARSKVVDKLFKGFDDEKLKLFNDIFTQLSDNMKEGGTND